MMAMDAQTPNFMSPMSSMRAVLVDTQSGEECDDEGELALLDCTSVAAGYVGCEPFAEPHTRYMTGDVWRAVPQAPGSDKTVPHLACYEHVCRRDDLLVMASGEMVNPVVAERLIGQHLAASAERAMSAAKRNSRCPAGGRFGNAMLLGSSFASVFLVVELLQPSCTGDDSKRGPLPTRWYSRWRNKNKGYPETKDERLELLEYPPSAVASDELEAKQAVPEPKRWPSASRQDRTGQSEQQLREALLNAIDAANECAPGYAAISRGRVIVLRQDMGEDMLPKTMKGNVMRSRAEQRFYVRSGHNSLMLTCPTRLLTSARCAAVARQVGGGGARQPECL